AFTGVAIELIPTDRFAKVKREKGRLTRYVQELMSERGLFSRIIMVSLALRLIALALPLITGMIIDRVVPRADYDLLYVCLAAIGGMTAFNLISDIVRMHLLLHLRIALDARMSLGFLDHMVSLPFAFFQRRSAGDLMMRLNGTSVVREQLTQTTLSGMLDGVMVAVSLLILAAGSGPMAGAAVVAAALEVGAYLGTRRRQRELVAHELEVEARAHGYEVEVLTAIETLKASGCERRAVERWSHLL